MHCRKYKEVLGSADYVISGIANTKHLEIIAYWAKLVYEHVIT